MILLAISLLAKLAVFFTVLSSDPSRFLTGDSWGYHDPARALLHIGQYSISPEEPHIPESIRTPGYPAFIAIVYALFGESFAAIIAVQIVLSLLTVVIVSKLGRELFGERVGLIAAVVLSLDVVSFSMTFFVLTETLFTLVFSISLLAGVHVLQHQPESQTGGTATSGAKRSEFLWASIMGLSLSLSILIRPVAYYLLPVLVVFFLLVGLNRHLGIRWMMKSSLAILVPALILVGGWQIRNANVVGSASLTQIEGVDALYYRAAAVVSLRDGVTLDEARRSLGGLSMSDAWNEVRKHPHRLLGDSWRSHALEVLISYPLLTMQMMLNGMINMCLGPGDGLFTGLLGWRSDKDGPLGDLVRLSPGSFTEKWLVGRPIEFLFFVHALGFIALLWLCFMIGIFRLLRTGEATRVHLFLLGVVVYFVVISAGPHSYYRFRMPLMPVLSVYSAYVLLLIADRRRHLVKSRTSTT